MIEISIFEKETLTNILVVIITIILSYFTLVFGELVPKKIGLAYSLKISFGMIDVINIVIKLCKPFIVILKVSTDFIVKFLRIEKKNSNMEEELKSSITDSNLEELEKKLLLNIFEFNDTTVDKVMTPMKEVVVIDADSSKEEILKVIKKNKFTRFPIRQGKEIIGVLNVKDLVIKHKEIFVLKDYIRNISTIKGDMVVDDAFFKLNSNYEVMAMVEVAGEYIGIVTLEDIVEEIIGNIFDEYDVSQYMGS